MVKYSPNKSTFWRMRTYLHERIMMLMQLFFPDFLYKSIWCGYWFELLQLVEANSDEYSQHILL